MKIEVVKPMLISGKEEQEFQNTTNCPVCAYELGADRVQSPCHPTIRYREAAHNEGNLNPSL